MKPFRPDRFVKLIGSLILSAALAASAGADELRSKLDALERDLDRKRSDKATLERTAQKTEQEIRALKLSAVNLATQLHERSEKIGLLEDRLEKLVRTEEEKSDRLIERRSELTATLGALQRIARLPTATLVAMPRPPDDTIRSAILLRSAVPELHREASLLSEEIGELARLQETIRNDRARLDDALAALDSERKRLSSLTARKMDLLQSTQSAGRRTAQDVARLSSQAGSLRGLLDRLEASRKEDDARREEPPAPQAVRPPLVRPPLVRPSPARQAPILPPAVTSAPPNMPAPGRVLRSFGEKLANGLLSRGVSIATRPAATIVAPRPGRVVYAGEFRGYGNLVILELADRGHALMAGLERIEAEIGDTVLAGEPLGQMSPSTNDIPTLYFELRRRGQPINPLPSSAALNAR